MRLLSTLALSVAALVLAPALAVAAPPVNDNYLSSIPLAPDPDTTVTADTTEAGTQTDLFNPSRDGAPLGGGAAEPLVCNGVAFAKTVWYDFAPRVNYGVSLRATGYATAVAVYEWNPTDSRITRMVGCSTNAAGEDLLLELAGKKNYTIQVGGVGGAGGALSLKMEAFADTDADGQLDALDKCPTVPGIDRSGGCPPSLRGRVSPSINYEAAGSGIKITRLVVDGVPKGARVVARCGGCGSQSVKAKRLGRVSLNKLVGRTVRAGAKVELRITMGRTGKGTYRFGATGSLFQWPVSNGATGKRVTKCLDVGTGKIAKRCS